MANPKDEFDRQQQAVAPTGQARSLAASTDPNNASRLAKVPAGIGGNPIVATSAPPAPVVLPQSNPIVKTATSVPQAAPPMSSASSPSNIYPQSSPSAGANVYGGAGFSRDQFGSSGQFAQVPSGIGGNPLVAAAKPNSYGDAAAAANTPGVAQLGAAKLGAPAVDTAAPATTVTAPQVASSATKAIAPTTATPGKGEGGPLGGFYQDFIDSTGQAVTDNWKQGNYARSIGNAARMVVGAIPIAGAQAAAEVGAPILSGIGNFVGGFFGGEAQAQPAQEMAGKSQALKPGQSTAGGGRGSINPAMADPTKPPPTMAETAPAAANPMTNWDRTGMTNAQVAAANPGGRVTMTRQPDGTMAFSGGDVSGPVSYMNAAGNPLVGGGVRGSGFSRVDSAPAGANVAMGPNGSFAYASGNPIVSSGQPAPAAAARQPGIAGGPAASGAVDAALAAAAQRGDFDAVRAHYAGRGQDFGGQGGAAQVQGVPAFTAPAVRHSGNDWAARNALSNLETSASSITNRPEWRSGAVTNASGRMMNGAAVDPDGKVARYNAAMQADLVAQGKVPDQQLKTNETNAGLQRAAMREQGENYRAAGRNAIAAAGIAQHSQELQSQAQLRNLEVQRAQRIAGIMQRYDSAKDDAERASIMRQHPDAFGQRAIGPQGKDRYITVGGGTSVVDGQTVKEPMSIFDTVNEQYVGGGQAKLPLEANQQAIAIRDNPKLSYGQKAAELRKLDY